MHSGAAESQKLRRHRVAQKLRRAFRAPGQIGVRPAFPQKIYIIVTGNNPGDLTLSVY